MTRIIASIALLLLLGIGKGYGMEMDSALALVQAWGRDSKDTTLIGQIGVDSQGGFLTKSAGAFFRYDPVLKQLSVSGLVGYNVKLHSKHPTTWQKMVRASQRESATLGEGALELYTQQLFGFDPDVILLTKTFSDDSIKSAQFVAEVGWLLSAAHYWFMKRYNDVLVTPEEDLIRGGPLINDRILKERPRPW